MCMISEAYPMLNSTDSSEKISKYLLSPTILELLKNFGVSHSKYGNYGKIIVQKYDWIIYYILIYGNFINI